MFSFLEIESTSARTCLKMVSVDGTICLNPVTSGTKTMCLLCLFQLRSWGKPCVNGLSAHFCSTHCHSCLPWQWQKPQNRCTSCAFTTKSQWWMCLSCILQQKEECTFCVFHITETIQTQRQKNSLVIWPSAYCSHVCPAICSDSVDELFSLLSFIVVCFFVTLELGLCFGCLFWVSYEGFCCSFLFTFWELFLMFCLPNLTCIKFLFCFCLLWLNWCTTWGMLAWKTYCFYRKAICLQYRFPSSYASVSLDFGHELSVKKKDLLYHNSCFFFFF